LILFREKLFLTKTIITSSITTLKAIWRPRRKFRINVMQCFHQYIDRSDYAETLETAEDSRWPHNPGPCFKPDKYNNINMLKLKTGQPHDPLFVRKNTKPFDNKNLR
jgi:hypothetical protein